MRWIADALVWFNAQPTGTQGIILLMLGGAGTAVISATRWSLRWYRRTSLADSARAWHEMEARFDRIPGEVEGYRSTYASGQVAWGVYAQKAVNEDGGPEGEGARRVQRFISEARAAARLARCRKRPGIDLADVWLNLVAANVHRGSSMLGDGHDEHGKHETLYFERLVDASKVMCGQLAADADEANVRH